MLVITQPKSEAKPRTWWITKIYPYQQCCGVIYRSFGKTEDGFETQFGVNHLGHFLFYWIRLNRGRIIMVSSIGHTMTSKLNLDMINSEAHYSPYDACQLHSE